MMFAVLTSVIVLAPQEPPSTGSVYQSPRAEVRLASRGEEATAVVQPVKTTMAPPSGM